MLLSRQQFRLMELQDPLGLMLMSGTECVLLLVMLLLVCVTHCLLLLAVCLLLQLTLAILIPFVACRLIPLDKRPGVRLIGIGMFLSELLPKPFFSLLVMMLYLLQVLYRLVLDMLLGQRLQFIPCGICFTQLIVKLPYW